MLYSVEPELEIVGAIGFHLFCFVPFFSPIVCFPQKCLERFKQLWKKNESFSRKAITFKLIEQVIREFEKYNSAIGFYSVHFIIRILSSAFYQPHFSIRVLWSSFFHPPPSGPHFIETRVLCRMLWRLGNTGDYWVLDWIRIPDKQIRFEYATCGRRIREEKLRIQKYQDTCGRGLETS